jgi:release factor-specific protein-(glutamine-N5) methyltransferase
LVKELGDKGANDLIVTGTMMFSLLLSVGLFVGIPTVLASIFKSFGLHPIALNLIESVIRVGILILYMYLVSKLDDIYRVFQYHGAEHKTIFCYENEEKLTVENVKRYSRFHPRCGTNFLFLTMFVSIIVFSLTGWGGIIQRIVLRVLLMPFVAGITYELIKWLGKTDSKLGKIIAYPGLKLQELTTKEPDDSQIEVAIASLLAAEGIEYKKKIGELLQEGSSILKEAAVDTYMLDSQLLLGKVINKDKLYLITNRDKEISKKNEKEYFELIEKRKNKMPIKYILKSAEFMGLDFNVEEGVLIPRPDTEILVEETLKYIPQDESMNVCDLCCGSGAIGIALASFRKNINIDLIDYYDTPMKVTESNIVKHNLKDRAKFVKSDLLKVVINQNKKYKILVSNPPYIKDEVIPTLMDDVKDYEPHTALSGGEDGLIFYRRIVEESSKVLGDDGILAFEIGHDQGEEVKKLMINNGYSDVRVVKDLAGLDRVVIGTLKS